MTYSNWSFGLYSLYFPSLNQMLCPKGQQLIFISILKPAFLKVCIISFLFHLFSVLKTISLSLYNPADYLSSFFGSKDSIWMPISSQISVPSKLLMVTLRQLPIVSFSFFESLLSLYNKNFLQYFLLGKLFSGIPMYCRANKIALSNIASDIDG